MFVILQTGSHRLSFGECTRCIPFPPPSLRGFPQLFPGLFTVFYCWPTPSVMADRTFSVQRLLHKTLLHRFACRINRCAGSIELDEVQHDASDGVCLLLFFSERFLQPFGWGREFFRDSRRFFPAWSDGDGWGFPFVVSTHEWTSVFSPLKTAAVLFGLGSAAAPDRDRLSPFRGRLETALMIRKDLSWAAFFFFFFFLFPLFAGGFLAKKIRPDWRTRMWMTCSPLPYSRRAREAVCFLACFCCSSHPLTKMSASSHWAFLSSTL